MNRFERKGVINTEGSVYVGLKTYTGIKIQEDP